MMNAFGMMGKRVKPMIGNPDMGQKMAPKMPVMQMAKDRIMARNPGIANNPEAMQQRVAMVGDRIKARRQKRKSMLPAPSNALMVPPSY